jgi:hypothetical protein
MKKSLILASLFVVPFAFASAADDAPVKPKRDPGQMFKNLDKDADGTLSFEEWKAGVIGQIDAARQPEVFKKKDADGDGKLTLPEYMHIPPREVPKPATDAKPEKKAKKEKPAAEKTSAPKQ